MPYKHSVVREGLIVGAMGATAVAVWFLIINGIAGRGLLYTPTVLGKALFRIFGPHGAERDYVYVIAYTIVHYGAFFVLGMLLSLLVHQAAEQPAVLALFLVLFVMMEIGFYGLTAIVSDQAILGAMAWYEIGLANLLAALFMGTYMWRQHPELRQEFAHALGNFED